MSPYQLAEKIRKAFTAREKYFEEIFGPPLSPDLPPEAPQGPQGDPGGGAMIFAPLDEEHARDRQADHGQERQGTDRGRLNQARQRSKRRADRSAGSMPGLATWVFSRSGRESPTPSWHC
jgi:hypothetical protein